MEECSLAVGNTTSLKTHNQHLEDKVAGDEHLGRRKYGHHDISHAW